MKVLVTGSRGLLGSHLVKVLTQLRHDVIGVTHDDIDLVTQPVKVIRILSEHRPDVVINCVGWANVDACQEDPNKAWLVNAESVVELARLTYAMNIRLIHISTDQVFDGKQGYCAEHAVPCPVNVYGWSKVGGERICLKENPDATVIRTSFYGWAPDGHTPTFADWLYTSLRDKKPIQLFDDSYFSALEVYYLAEALEKVIQKPMHGILNIVSNELFSKAQFGKSMADVFGLSMDAVTIGQSEYVPLRVKRPYELSLSIGKFYWAFGYKPAGLLAGLHRLKKEKK